MTPAGGQYLATPPTLVDGQVRTVRLSEDGALVVAQGAPAVALPTRSILFDDADASVTAAATELVALGAMNAGASAVFVQVFDKATAPAGGDVPAFVFTVPAGGGVLVDSTWWQGARVAAGLAVGVSTTHATFTAAAFAGVVELLHRPAV